MSTHSTALLIGASIVASTAVACGGATRAAPSKNAAGCRDAKAAAVYGGSIRTARPLVRRLHAGLRAPGMSLAVAVDGKIVWSVTCGYADVRSRRAVRENTRFRIGSVSKTLTAAALMHYVESGTVELDAPIQRYVPSFPSHGGGITLRRLAGHLAGIRHYETRAEAVNTRHFQSVSASLGIFAHDPLVAAPGTEFAYSSYGYDLIGAALEGATGTSFATLVGESVLAPAHLDQTTLLTAPAAQRATFYELTNESKPRLAPPIDLSDRLPAGGFLSTATDLARFGSALVAGTLVMHSTASVMFASQKAADGKPTGYGIGFEVHPSPFGLFVGHTGAVDGGTAVLLVHPKTRAVLALATNLGYATAESPPPPRRGTPDPPMLLLPFVE